MEVTSKAMRTRVLGDGLSQLRRQFDQWRAGGKVGERIPLELWADAVAAAVEHGAYRVAAVAPGLRRAQASSRTGWW